MVVCLYEIELEIELRPEKMLCHTNSEAKGRSSVSRIEGRGKEQGIYKYVWLIRRLPSALNAISQSDTLRTAQAPTSRDESDASAATHMLR